MSLLLCDGGPCPERLYCSRWRPGTEEGKKAWLLYIDRSDEGCPHRVPIEVLTFEVRREPDVPAVSSFPLP